MKLYKLTDEDGKTYNDTQWGENVTHKAKPGEGELCSEYYIHAYTDPLLAVLLNPIHADFKNPRLWEAKGRVMATGHGLKVGCKTLTTIREIPLPVITQEQRIRFAILCAQQVYKDKKWNSWANKWLSSEDRSEAAAEAAEAAEAAKAAQDASWAAQAASWAAQAASWAAQDAQAAQAVVWAAQAADVDLIALAHEAVEGGK